MEKYRCAYCGEVFDPVKSGVCPNCGAAVPPAVLIRVEREQSAFRGQNQQLKETTPTHPEQISGSG